MDEKETERLIKLESITEQHSQMLKEHNTEINELKNAIVNADKSNLRLENKIDQMNISIVSELKSMKENFSAQNKNFDEYNARLEKIEKERIEEKTKPAKKLSDIKWDVIAKIIGIIAMGTAYVVAIGVAYYLFK